ncbi:aspartate/glutamate racemase family protein [Pseudoteredinibacter isoporae]|uniref:Allantoin racemase n=1 Tax=Pseudoteredinibacter isoporae TaxID=570281 RepID=A0A7X0MUQ5_9GAMM|nr:aspartate/glutamate racemase family protein [Pseudoteredinibacter isoporae]MBB6520275.1 allantoin racemase [Pseudoteredinibacter isoporae]NHO85846.1 hydantoin racemase [Pseudoteredinibacter isoporae]NIB25702.1 hydantoin racemase [Pseudoteredinibacter isoporae]
MANIKLCYIDPVSSPDFLPELVQHFQCLKETQCQIDVVSLRAGLPWDNLEYHSYEALVSADLVKAIHWAEKAGYDAAVIGCFYDLCLHEAREICEQMIVTAPCQSALQTASLLANRASIIIGRSKWRQRISENLHRYGYQNFIASLPDSQCRVSDYLNHQHDDIESFEALAHEAIQQDGAEAIILGCSANLGVYKRLQDRISVPVIDPALAALAQAKLAAQNKQQFGWHSSSAGSLEAPWSDPRAGEYFMDAEKSIGKVLRV